jgi:hypothetical protein
MLANTLIGHGPVQAPPPLPTPFDRLVAQGTLTDAQARTVMDALGSAPAADEATPPVPAARPALTRRLAEVGAYLGAALVVAAGIVVVAQQWVDMTYGSRVGVMVGTSLVLIAAATGLLLFCRGRTWDDVPNGDALRRLSGTLYALSALAVYGTVLVAMLSGQTEVSDDEAAMAFLVAGLGALVVLLIARLRADTPLGELGLVASSVAVVMAGVQLWIPDQPVTIQWTLLAVGLGWALVGTYTSLMRHHILTTALGLLLALFGAATIAEQPWSHRLALLTLIAVALAVYLTRPTWPYIAVATVAAVVLTVTWVGEAVGAAMALLAAGVVVLVLAGGALYLHMHRKAEGAQPKTATPSGTTSA